MIKVSAPGKIHLLGEHSSVYGKPAILTAINKRMFVTLAPRSDKIICLSSKGVGEMKGLTEEKIIKQTEDSQRKWKKFIETNDISLLRSITENPLDYVIIAIGETLKFYNQKFLSGFDLKIESQIPEGAGLGTSAVTALVVAGAITLFLGKDFNRDIIYQIACVIEHKKHGHISGGDISAPCFGKLVWFRTETDDFRIILPLSFSIDKKLAENFVLIDSGKPRESTGEMVGLVRKLQKENPNLLNKFLENQEILVKNLLEVIKHSDEKEFIRIIRDGERNLESIGVVSLFVKSIIRKIEKAGGAAKICGGGG
ncbi:hypothetical protein HYU94_03955, partial [Candidatus Daviesbacteria bacterium]|nr:hypothetical protein [Candidatus Daviesbacteria bacterium]